MLYSASLALLATATGLVAAAPATHGYSPFPLKDGFPSPSPQQLKKIELAAGGSLPNGGLPTKLTDAGALTLQLIAANEVFEVAYFTSFLQNVTDNKHGYKTPNKKEKAELVEILTRIVKQEELHAIGANAILASAGRETIKPCRYQFPVSNAADAFVLANTFTDVVLSVLPLAQTTFAVDGGQETGLIQLVGSIIAQEGEQNGFYRYVQDKVPSAAPFLTTSNPVFAFNALKSFIVPGSCPNLDVLEKNIPTLPALTVVSQGKAPKDGQATFSVKGKLSAGSHSVAYLTGQNVPVIAKIQDAKYKKGMTTFKADLPFSSKGFAKGLTVAAVIKGNKAPTAAAVAGATVYGPGLIEVQ